MIFKLRQQHAPWLSTLLCSVRSFCRFFGHTHASTRSCQVGHQLLHTCAGGHLDSFCSLVCACASMCMILHGTVLFAVYACVRTCMIVNGCVSCHVLSVRFHLCYINLHDSKIISVVCVNLYEFEHFVWLACNWMNSQWRSINLRGFERLQWITGRSDIHVSVAVTPMWS